jgi:hypothetical protein
MTEEKRYFPQVYKEPFTPDLEVDLDEQWRQMAADLLMEDSNVEEKYDIITPY